MRRFTIRKGSEQMKDIIKGFVPQSIREGVIGDLYRMLRGRDKTNTDFTRQSSEGPLTESTSDRTTPEKEEVSEEMEEFEVDVRPRQLQAWVDDGTAFDIVDIREPYEVQQGHLSNSIFIPMNDVPNEYHNLSMTKPVVVVCAAGMRSWSVAQYLRNQGLDNVWSLENGSAAWSEHGHVSPHKGRFSVGTKVAVGAAFIEDLSEKPSVQYGYIHNCSLEDSKTLYDVQFWSASGVVIAKRVPESEVEPFVASL